VLWNWWLLVVNLLVKSVQGWGGGLAGAGLTAAIVGGVLGYLGHEQLHSHPLEQIGRYVFYAGAGISVGAVLAFALLFILLGLILPWLVYLILVLSPVGPAVRRRRHRIDDR
jgi:hypothetical protein